MTSLEEVAGKLMHISIFPQQHIINISFLQRVIHIDHLVGRKVGDPDYANDGTWVDSLQGPASV